MLRPARGRARAMLAAAAWSAVVLLLAGCGAATQGDDRPLLVLAASDLQLALPELALEYERLTGQSVTVTMGSTGNLAAQIEHGAPADLFFAADRSFIERLDAGGHLRRETRAVYGVGRIVLVTAPGREADGLQDLAGDEFRHIAIANPDHAPYGRAAREALAASGVWEHVEGRLVPGENVSQAFQFVQTGNADAGITALSVLLGAPGTRYSLIDEALHGALVQEAAVTRSSGRPERAAEFLRFVLGPEGQQIMERYGFTLPLEGNGP